MFGISRGFRRLSVVVGFIGATFIGFICLHDGRLPTVGDLMTMLAILVVVPMTFVLLLGWAIAGFRDSN